MNENKSDIPPIDPTANVLKLVEEAVKRGDDLRKAEREYVREVIGLHKQINDLHVMYAEKLRIAESDRINALRVGDMGSVTLANEKANAQASVLANQLQQYDERNRNLVTTTATTIATQLTQIINPIVGRLDALEKSQYENQGSKTGVKDFRDWFPWVFAIIMFALYMYDKFK